MTYTIDICRYLVRCLALPGQGKKWLIHCPDNVTEWEIGPWCQQPGLLVGRYYEVAMNQYIP